MPPEGSFSDDPPFDVIMQDLATRTTNFNKQERVWILGDSNARVGDLPNQVEGKVARESEDPKTTHRGRRMLETLNTVN